MKHEDKFTVKQLLVELNSYRTTMGVAPVKEWKQSRSKLIDALRMTSAKVVEEMDPLAIPTYLNRKNPMSFIHQTITPEMQARIDAAMVKTRTAVVASSFAQFDTPAKARAPKVGEAKPRKVPPPADTFHLTSLGEGRVLRAIARKHTAFLQPLEAGMKYIYKNADKEKITAFIKEHTS